MRQMKRILAALSPAQYLDGALIRPLILLAALLLCAPARPQEVITADQLATTVNDLVDANGRLTARVALLETRVGALEHPPHPRKHHARRKYH